MTSPRNRLNRISHHRRWWRASLALVAVCILFSPRCDADAHAAPASPGFKVIVHPSNPVTTLGADTLRQIFLKQKVRWDNGDTIKPVDLKLQSPVREEFSSEVLARSAQTVRTYWLQRIFSGGQVPPPELASDEAVIRYVASEPGAVGYVSSTADSTAAKTLTVR